MDFIFRKFELIDKLKLQISEPEKVGLIRKRIFLQTVEQFI